MTRAGPIRAETRGTAHGDSGPAARAQHGLVDAMAHIELLADPHGALEAAARAGVSDVVSAGVSPADAWPDLGPDGLGAAAGPSPARVHRAVGLHPMAIAPGRLDAQLADLEALAARVHAEAAQGGPRLVAIGECGLDKRRDMPPMDEQEAAFAAQHALAVRYGLPLVLHVVRAPGRMLALLDKLGVPAAGALWHGFSGPAELVPGLVDRGVVLSVGPGITRPGSHRVHKAARAIPLSHLAIETDAPAHGLTPGTHAALADLPAVASALAALRGEPAAAITAASAAAARRVYGLA